jgi:hypothetical protein
MHSYRNSATRVEHPPRPNRDELIIYALLTAIGLIPVAIALITHDRFGLDGTLRLLMSLIGLAGIAVQGMRARHHVRARRPR